jgi:tetratricopeptide (TPR) repeat protein
MLRGENMSNNRIQPLILLCLLLARMNYTEAAEPDREQISAILREVPLKRLPTSNEERIIRQGGTEAVEELLLKSRQPEVAAEIFASIWISQELAALGPVALPALRRALREIRDFQHGIQMTTVFSASAYVKTWEDEKYRYFMSGLPRALNETESLRKYAYRLEAMCQFAIDDIERKHPTSFEVLTGGGEKSGSRSPDKVPDGIILRQATELSMEKNPMSDLAYNNQVTWKPGTLALAPGGMIGWPVDQSPTLKCVFDAQFAPAVTPVKDATHLLQLHLGVSDKQKLLLFVRSASENGLPVTHFSLLYGTADDRLYLVSEEKASGAPGSGVWTFQFHYGIVSLTDPCGSVWRTCVDFSRLSRILGADLNRNDPVYHLFPEEWMVNSFSIEQHLGKLDLRRVSLDVRPDSTLTPGQQILLDQFEEMDTLMELESYVIMLARECGTMAPVTLEKRCELGVQLRLANQLAESVAVLKDVHEKRRALYGAQHPKTYECAGELALSIQSNGDPEEARAMLLETYESARCLLGDDDLDTITLLRKLCDLLILQKRWSEAESFCRRMVDSTSYFEMPSWVRTKSELVLARVLLNLQRPEESLPLHLKCLSLESELRIIAQGKPIDLVCNLAASYSDAGNSAAAMRIVEESLKRIPLQNPGEAADYRNAYQLLGPWKIDSGDYAGAEEAIQKLETLFVSYPAVKAEIDNPLVEKLKGSVAYLKKDYALAAKHFRSALAALDSLRDANPILKAFLLLSLADVQSWLNETDEAIKSTTELISYLESCDMSATEWQARAFLYRSTLQRTVQDYAKGLEDVRTSLTVCDSLRPVPHRLKVQALLEEAILLRKLGQHQPSLRSSAAALEVLSALKVSDLDVDLIRCQIGKGLTLAAVGDVRNAEPLLRQGYESRLKLFGPNHTETIKAKEYWDMIRR